MVERGALDYPRFVELLCRIAEVATLSPPAEESDDELDALDGGDGNVEVLKQDKENNGILRLSGIKKEKKSALPVQNDAKAASLSLKNAPRQ